MKETQEDRERERGGVEPGDTLASLHTIPGMGTGEKERFQAEIRLC